jgi:hypothetical protein
MPLNFYYFFAVSLNAHLYIETDFNEMCRLGSSGSGEGPVVDFCEHCNERSGSIKDGESSDQLSDY